MKALLLLFLRDDSGRGVAEALLVAIASPRLRHLGFHLPADNSMPQRPEHQLYTLLSKDDERNAYSRYNALIRRLVSFERAMEFEQARAARLGNI